jgi:hypothetical protein
MTPVLAERAKALEILSPKGLKVKALWFNFGNGQNIPRHLLTCLFLCSLTRMCSWSLWLYFHKGDRQNTVHFMTYCNGCMEHHSRELLSEQRDDMEMDDASWLERKTRIFNEGN